MNYIKVKLNGETVWATRIDTNTVTIDNLPLDPRVSYMDKVKIDENNNFIEVIERINRQAIVQYDCDDLENKWEPFCKMLMDNGIHTEGMIRGTVILAFDKNRNEQEITELIETTDIGVFNILFQPLVGQE